MNWRAEVSLFMGQVDPYSGSIGTKTVPEDAQIARPARIGEAISQRDPRLLPALLLAGLVAGLYAPVLAHLVEQWWEDPNYGHGFFIPLFVGSVLWQTRNHWVKIEARPSNFGLLVMLGAIGLLIVGSLGAELFTTRSSLVFLLAGMVLFLAGWKMLRAVAFPLGSLMLMIPLPVIIYNQITFPLQFVASKLAASCLESFRVPNLREGNVLLLPGYALEVAEACSGIRSLMSLMALAIVYGYFAEKRLWARIALAILMVPIAVASNAARIVGTGILAYFFGHQGAEGFFHFFSGWLIFLFAVGGMLLAHALLKQGGKLGRWTRA